MNNSNDDNDDDDDNDDNMILDDAESDIVVTNVVNKITLLQLQEAEKTQEL